MAQECKLCDQLKLKSVVTDSNRENHASIHSKQLNLNITTALKLCFPPREHSDSDSEIPSEEISAEDSKSDLKPHLITKASNDSNILVSFPDEGGQRCAESLEPKEPTRIRVFFSKESKDSYRGPAGKPIPAKDTRRTAGEPINSSSMDNCEEADVADTLYQPLTDERREARYSYRFSDKVQHITKNMAKFCRSNGVTIRCQFGGNCKFTTPMIGPTPNDLTNSFRKINNHILRHLPEKMYFCKICHVSCRTIDHAQLHKDGRKFLVDFFDENEEKILKIYSRCFPGMPERFVYVPLARPLTAAAKRPRRGGIFIPSLPKLEIDKGKPHRSWSAAYDKSTRKALRQYVAKCLMDGYPIKCRYGGKCDLVWQGRITEVSKKSNATVKLALNKIYPHVLSHHGETLYYCITCRKWLMHGSNHQKRMHRGTKSSEHMLDFFDQRKEALFLNLEECFPELEDMCIGENDPWEGGEEDEEEATSNI